MSEPAPGPVLVRRPTHLRELARGWASSGLRSGLVPTMGGLHQGHLALVKAARRECDRVVVSIFVNPLQFGLGEDFRHYPRRPTQDLARLRRWGVDACYWPATSTMYPAGFATQVQVAGAGERWEARRRPGHFAGVATVVAKLLAACAPARAYFGDKDAQQVAVVTRMARDLDLGVQIRVRPTVREPDGLACSSRNRLLSAAGRRAAPVLAQALAEASRRFAAGETGGPALERAARQLVAAEPKATLDYAGVVDPVDFEPVEVADAASRVMLAVAIDGVHLIDTARLGQPPRLKA
ncbi:MAG: pantoate--beta-alanine ligase [Candidatus Dormibacteria bacterium]